MYAEQRRQSRDALLVLTGASPLLAARLITPAQSESGPVLCPFRLLTGIPCPACGLTRSWVHAAHGEWSEAFALHLVGPVLMALVLVSTIVVAGHWAIGRWWVAPRWLGWAFGALTVVMGVWWVVRGLVAGWSG